MKNKIKIEDIINYLEAQKYSYSFNGNKKDHVKGFSTLFNYKENSLTFVSSLNDFSDYESKFENENIKLIITSPKENAFPCFTNVIQVENPKKMFFLILDNFFDDNSSENRDLVEENIIKNHSYISKKASIGENVTIGYGCVIEDNVNIGDNTVIHHNVVIKRNTKIGKNCSVYSGVVIGERGFNPFTEEDLSRTMLKHYGGVTIEDNVHIGENSCLIRGAIDDTVIREGAKLNTMVHVAHNCLVGKNTVITMPTHICGSVVIGENCHIAATTIRNQCKIGDNAVLGLGSVVVKDVATGTTVIGNPAKPLKK